MKIFISLLLILVVFSSCKKTEEPEKVEKHTSDLYPLKINKNTIGLITLTSHTFARNSNKFIDIRGVFQKPYFAANGAEMLDAGIFIINNDTINKYPDFKFDENMDGSKIESYFGNTTSYTVTGNSVNEIDLIKEDLYIPKAIQMIPLASNFISKNISDTIKWKSDSNYTEKVYIEINYNGTINHRHDNSLPSKDIWFQEHIIDNGFYVIPKSVLEKMPTNGTIEILIARNVYNISTQKNGKEVHFLATTTNADEFIITE